VPQSREAIPATLPSEFVEWAILMMIENGFMRPQLGAVVTLDGKVQAQRLARAVRLVLDAEPVLGCRFVADAKKPYWERLTTLDDRSALTVEDADDPDAAAREFIASAFDPAAGPQLQARLLRGPHGDVLAMKLSHLAVDGGAVKECLYLVADLYRRLGLQPDLSVTPNLDGARSLLPAAREASWSERLRALKPQELLPKTDWGIPGLGRERGHQQHLVRRVPPDAFGRLRQWGRDRGATVNDMILTAYIRSLFAALRPAPGDATPVQLSCDLRRWLPADTKTALSNISATWSIDIPRVEGESFAGTLARVVERTGAWKAGAPGVRQAVGLSMAYRLVMPQGIGVMRRPMKNNPVTDTAGYPTLTNIGVIDEAKVDFGRETAVADAYLLGPIAFPTGYVLTASTFRDELTLSTGIDTLAIDLRLAESLLDGTVRELGSAAG
jgi:NRPS condensation-like uncharacterized protein